jgi:hypothetical protein
MDASEFPRPGSSGLDREEFLTVHPPPPVLSAHKTKPRGVGAPGAFAFSVSLSG